MDSETINRCFLRFEDRAERITPKQVAETFVSIGPLMDLLASRNNQIVYGRRGTGKTHALRYFQNTRNTSGDIAIYIDAQNIGSNGSIYNDHSIPVSERATRLLVDVCSAIHHELQEVFSRPGSKWGLAEAAPLLDGFVDGYNEMRVTGKVKEEEANKNTNSKNNSSTAGLSFDGKLNGKVEASRGSAYSSETSDKREIEGSEETWIDFTFFSRAIRSLAKFIAPMRIWLLIDEWTTVPPAIQPYLADLIRRSMFNVPNITVKIAAIEHRSVFKIDRQDEGYIGFELGADISAAINMDDYLVIDNNEARAKQFFRQFISNHAAAVADEINVKLGGKHRVIAQAFTQDNVFTEFVRATEGVPRDAMHILSLAAQRAGINQISMPIIRQSAYNFFQSEKYSAIQANRENVAMLEWIRDEVIGDRRTRAFLLPVSADDTIIDRLFDRRALHILNRNRSAAHRPGERFIVYKLDYGLYVDLSNTDKFPDGLLVPNSQDIDADFEVPIDDARSYRRAILDLDNFYKTHGDILRKGDNNTRTQ
ncbi:hypothetical protein ABZT49_12255 [Methylobacterium sp. EM32]|uniref:ORC-CDC6 family AAA ATPase n=1 Tax=Methylobacterium sp. EM32 TaxID=3163481 RepID=UPI0033A399A5